MKNIIEWHRITIYKILKYFNISMYKALWLAFIKGLILGILL
jgi:hypothetical protein